MSIQDRIEFSNIKLRRRLFDQQIKLMGKVTNAVRLSIDKNRYEDGEIKVVSKDIVECVIAYPGDVPLIRGRKPGEFVNESSNPHLFLMDVIPIDLYVKWTDNVERYDFIIDKVIDENGNYIKFLLQVSEVVGSFRSSLLYKKCQCAPYSGAIPDQIQFILDGIQ